MLTSTDRESEIIRATEQAIRLANSGSSPNEALYKVAFEHKFQPPIVCRMVEAFNKSKSVHILKTAGSSRHEPFDLADSTVILAKLYPAPNKEKVAAQFKLPTNDFSTCDFLAQKFEKTASAPAELHPQSVLNNLEKHAALCRAVQNKLHTRVLVAKKELHDAIDKTAEFFLSMPEDQLRKVAQVVLNGYPTHGGKLLELLVQRTRRSIPLFNEKLAREEPEKYKALVRDNPKKWINKTASAQVFPHTEPYVMISRICESAEKLARSENDCRAFDKDAQAGVKALTTFLHEHLLKKNVELDKEALLGSGFGTGIKSYLGARLGTIGSFRPGEKPAAEIVGDPIIMNRMRELDAKKNFMLLSLYDENLSKYEHKDLVKAYNDSVMIVPEAHKNPVMLRNLMIRNLESGGVKDVFELSQEVALSRALQSRGDLSRRAEATEKERAAKQRAAATPLPTEIPPAAPSRPGKPKKTLFEAVRERNKEKEERRKGRWTIEDRARTGREREDAEAEKARTAPERMRQEQEKIIDSRLHERNQVEQARQDAEDRGDFVTANDLQRRIGDLTNEIDALLNSP